MNNPYKKETVIVTGINSLVEVLNRPNLVEVHTRGNGQQAKDEQVANPVIEDVHFMSEGVKYIISDDIASGTISVRVIDGKKYTKQIVNYKDLDNVFKPSLFSKIIAEQIRGVNGYYSERVDFEKLK